MSVAEKNNGITYQVIPIGHSPYSACVIYNDYVLVGGGEPPVKGLLFCFKIISNKPKRAILSHFERGNYIESEVMEMLIEADEKVQSIVIDASVISSENFIMGRKISTSFSFKVPIKKSSLSGYFCLPLSIVMDNIETSDAITIFLHKKKQLPSKCILKRYNKLATQIHQFSSGSALAQQILNVHGKEISQKEHREIIDYVKEKSQWEDSDFQTWRLILKRVLSSPAKSLDEFVKQENNPK